MVEVAEKLSSKDFSEQSLGYRFPDFESFWKGLQPRLSGVMFKVLKKVDDDKTVVDWVKTGEGLTYYNSEFDLGILANFVAKNLYYKFRDRKYVGDQRGSVDEFMSETAFIIAEVRKKEHIWSQLYLEINKIIKLDRIDAEKITGSDKAGKTTIGDGSKHQVLGKELTEKTGQYGTVSSFDQKGSTIITTHKGTNYMPLVKILGALSQLQIDFSTFYLRFEHLWDHYSAPTLEWVIDKTTGRKKWVTEEEYIEIVEPEKAKEKKKLGPDAFAVLDEYQKTRNWDKYLEALAIYHDQNEKEHDKLPETSNRKFICQHDHCRFWQKKLLSAN